MTSDRLRCQLLAAVPEALFGSFDGLNTAVGAVAGSPHLAVRLALDVSVAGMMSMAAGEWLSDTTTTRVQAAVMGAATFAGTFLPCLPAIADPGPAGLGAAMILGVLVAVACGRARAGRRAPTQPRRWRPYLTALTMFAAVAIPTALVGAA